MEIFVVSDLHLGSHLSNHQQFENFIEEVKPRKLVLLGDIFENWHASSSEIFKVSYRILKAFAKCEEVIYVLGNHDYTNIDFKGEYENLKIVKDIYVEKIGEYTYYFIHGHQFDKILVKWEILANAMGFLKPVIRRILILRRVIDYLTLLDMNSLRAKPKYKKIDEIMKENYLTPKIEKKIAKYDKNVLVFGHTHMPEVKKAKGRNFKIYANSGSWMKRKERKGFSKPLKRREINVETNTFLKIGENGVKLYKYLNPGIKEIHAKVPNILLSASIKHLLASLLLGFFGVLLWKLSIYTKLLSIVLWIFWFFMLATLLQGSYKTLEKFIGVLGIALAILSFIL